MSEFNEQLESKVEFNQSNLNNEELINQAKLAINERGFWRILGFDCLITFFVASAGGVATFALLFVGNSISTIFGYLSAVILASYIMGVIKRETFSFDMIKTVFQRVGNIIGSFLLSSIIIAIPMIITAFVMGVTFASSHSQKSPAMIAIFPIALIGIIGMFVISYRYRLIMYLLAEDRLLPVSVLVKRSEELMRDYKLQGFLTELRYFAIPVILMFGVTVGISTAQYFKINLAYIILGSTILGLVALATFIYAMIVVMVYWGTLYLNLKETKSKLSINDEELYGNYKMSTGHTVGVILLQVGAGFLGVLIQFVPEIVRLFNK